MSTCGYAAAVPSHVDKNLIGDEGETDGDEVGREDKIEKLDVEGDLHDSQ